MRFLRLLLVVVVIAVLLASQAARFLVVDNPQKSDAIVVLAGETSARPAHALELLRQGMAPRLLLDAEAGELIYHQQLTDIAQKYLNTLPERDSISVCAIVGRSTAAETEDVARCLQSMAAHRVLIVTSEYHTRRALMIFSHRLPQYQWSVAAARNPTLFGAAWWTNREWAKVILNEWTRLIWWEAVDRWRSSVPSTQYIPAFGECELGTGYWQLLSVYDSLKLRNLNWRVHGASHNYGAQERFFARGRSEWRDRNGGWRGQQIRPDGQSGFLTLPLRRIRQQAVLRRQP